MPAVDHAIHVCKRASADANGLSVELARHALAVKQRNRLVAVEALDLLGARGDGLDVGKPERQSVDAHAIVDDHAVEAREERVHSLAQHTHADAHAAQLARLAL